MLITKKINYAKFHFTKNNAAHWYDIKLITPDNRSFEESINQCEKIMKSGLDEEGVQYSNVYLVNFQSHRVFEEIEVPEGI